MSEEYSRKRPADGDGVQQVVKRTAPAPGEIVLKMLVPNNTAGLIIGKGGQSVVKLQAETGARIKLSQNREFFPGTQDRVIMMQGSVASVAAALKFIVDKTSQDPAAQVVVAPGAGAPGTAAEAPVEGAPATVVQIRLIVPGAGAGMIIGRGGENIRAIQELTGVRINISPKEQEYETGERIVTITGAPDKNDLAIKDVLAKVQESAEKFTYQNMSTNYGANNRGGGGGDRWGGPPQGNFGGGGGAYGGGNYGGGGYGGGGAYGGGGYGGGAYGGQGGAGAGSYGGGSYGGGAYGQGAGAGSYGGGSYGGGASYGGQQRQQAPAQGQYGGGSYGGASYGSYGGGGSAGAVGQAPQQQRPAAAVQQAQTGATGAEGGAQTSYTVHVPDELVGAIVGRGGEVITQMKQYSGARIQISQKGDYAPGTRERVVTISGTQEQASMAQSMVTQKVTEAKLQRGL